MSLPSGPKIFSMAALSFLRGGIDQRLAASSGVAKVRWPEAACGSAGETGEQFPPASRIARQNGFIVIPSYLPPPPAGRRPASGAGLAPAARSAARRTQAGVAMLGMFLGRASVVHTAEHAAILLRRHVVRDTAIAEALARLIREVLLFAGLPAAPDSGARAPR